GDTGRGDLLIDQQEVADEERGLHGAGGDAKGLDDKGDDEDRGHHNGKQRLDGGQNALVAVMQRGIWNGRSRDDTRNGGVGIGWRIRVDGWLSHLYTSKPSLPRFLTRPLAISSSVERFSERRRSMAMRAASCWACFLVVPSDSASAMAVPSLSSMRTSTRKRF